MTSFFHVGPLLFQPRPAPSSSGGALCITESAIRALQEHDWPGNVRELRHVIARALALTPSRTLDRASISIAFDHGMNRRAHALPDARRQIILETLEKTSWDAQDAAQRLGVHRATLYRWMRQYGIQSLREFTPTERGTR